MREKHFYLNKKVRIKYIFRQKMSQKSKLKLANIAVNYLTDIKQYHWIIYSSV